MLTRYESFYNDLVLGVRLAESDARKHFVLVANRESPPKADHEFLYLKHRAIQALPSYFSCGYFREALMRNAEFFDDLEMAVNLLKNRSSWFSMSASILNFEAEIRRAYYGHSKINNYGYSTIYTKEHHNLLHISFLEDLFAISSILSERDSYVKRENSIDLHGLTVSEALVRVDLFIRDSYDKNIPSVKLIHGHNRGTAIRDALWMALQNNQFSEFVPKCDSEQLLEKLTKFNFYPDYLDGSEMHAGFPALGHESSFIFYPGSMTIPLLIENKEIWAYSIVSKKD